MLSLAVDILQAFLINGWGDDMKNGLMVYYMSKDFRINRSHHAVRAEPRNDEKI